MPVSPPPTGSTYALSFQGYDYGSLKEVTISLNDGGVISLPASESPQNNLYTRFMLGISKYLVTGSNTITFTQNLYSSGIKNLVDKNSISLYHNL